ncbi:MAG: response regulator transcription factor [Pseudomarimonas sp.]
MTHLLIADDHPLYRIALTQAVRGLLPDAQVDEADSLATARACLLANPGIDLVLLDLHMPDSFGLMGLAALRAEFPSVAVAMISAHDDSQTVARAFTYGAAGFIPKRADMAQLQAALRALLACETWPPHGSASSAQAAKSKGSEGDQDRLLATRLASLTPQQFRVLERISQGRLNKQIADTLNISERTVKAHVSVIFEKLGVRNRTQAGLLLRRLDVLDPTRQVDDD